VKAAFLYNFARYVDWPQDRVVGSFVITVLGEDPFGPSLDEVLDGKTLEGRPIVLRRVARAEDAGGSQILFIADSESERLRSILDYLGGQAILTVGETAQFADGGGVIGFRLEDDRVRLDVNLSAAQRSGLRISSELLKLARIVGMLPTED
jgi:hypothetical protein